MNLVDRNVPISACTVAPGRPVAGIVLHHTAGQSDPFPLRGASWHYLVARDGQTVFRDVDEAHAAHHAGATDRWRPNWVQPSPVGVSDINWCSCGIEITYAPQFGEVPSAAQHQVLKELLHHLYAAHGPLPVVLHGEIDLNKWPSEPHGLNLALAGLSERGADGHWLLHPIGEEDVAISPEDQAILDVMHGLGANAGSITGWIEKLGAQDQVIADQAVRIQTLETAAAQVPTHSDIPVPPRVEIVQANGRRDGFIPET